MKVAIEAPTPDVNVIKELLSPWDILFTEPDEADISIIYNQKPCQIKAAVMIPYGSAGFVTCAKETDLDVTRKIGYLTSVNATDQTKLTFTPEFLYCFGKLAKVAFEEETLTEILTKDDKLILKIDLVEEYRLITEGILHPEQSTFHRVVTGLPIPYGLAPRRLRDFLMKTDKGVDLALNSKLPLDALRFLLVNAIEKICGEKLKKTSLFAHSNVCILTHDVETTIGLQRTRSIKKIEEKYDVGSVWYVPSNRYKLDKEIVRELSNHGEVGSHDTKHDGKLVHLKERELVERLKDSRLTLEKIVEKPVVGFRAPMLQHNHTILQAIKEAGYLYDTSVPTWEPKHPYTMKPHGIGTVFPLKLNGLPEIPLTLTQDHQLIHVLGLSSEKVLKSWETMASVIRDIGGVSVFLVHPDYELADSGTELYEQLISDLTSDSKTVVTVPSKIYTTLNE